MLLDEVIGSNEEQAVLEYLEQLLDRLELRTRRSQRDAQKPLHAGRRGPG